MVTSSAKVIKKSLLLCNVLKILKWSSETSLQLIRFTMFINMNVWKHIVLRTMRGLGVVPYVGVSGSVMMLNDSSKKINCPQNISTHITTIW